MSVQDGDAETRPGCAVSLLALFMVTLIVVGCVSLAALPGLLGLL